MKRPIPVTLLAADYGLSSLIGLWSIRTGNAMLRNYPQFSSPGGHDRFMTFMAFYVLLLGLFFLLAFGLWKMHEWARQIAVFFKGLGLIMSSLGLLGAGYSALMSGTARAGMGTWMQIQSISSLLTLVTAGIPFFYLRHPVVRQMFRSAGPFGLFPSGFPQSLSNFGPKWIVWLGGSIALVIIQHYQGGSGAKDIQASLNQTLHPSLQELEQRATSATPQSRFYMLAELAKTAYKETQFDKAKTYARELLDVAAGNPSDGNYGNAIHHGHLILGRLALRESQLEEAKQHLLAAGKTPGSPQLNSFGPNMALAKELLEKNERQIVLQYFDLCRRFWNAKFSKLDQWAATVRRGGIPDFGANLEY